MTELLTRTERELLPRRARSLEDVTNTIGDISTEISQLIDKNGFATVLEIGCGFGRVLMQLQSMFGDRLHLTGLNRSPEEGDLSTALRVSEWFGMPISSLSPLPDYKFADASKRLPFGDSTFDLVYSNMTLCHVARKSAFIEEVYRVLKLGATAAIDSKFELPQLPAEVRLTFEVIANDRSFSFWEYFSDNIELQMMRAKKGRFLKIVRTSDCLSLGLQLEKSVLLSELRSDWYGCKSIFRPKVDST